MQAIDRYEIKTLVIAHKDRLVHFGFGVQDLMTIVHCFSSQLYGLRNYRKTLADALKGPLA